MTPLPMEAVTLNWHDADFNLSTPGGANEAKQFLNRVNGAYGGEATTFNYDDSGRFWTTGTVAQAEATLKAADPNWSKDTRFHLEIDPIRANF